VPPLRVAVIAPPFYEVPPESYGGSELVCWSLVEALVDHGHDVTLVHAGPPHSRARSIATFAKPPAEGRDEVAVEALHALLAVQSAALRDADVVHDHTRLGALTASIHGTPTVVTVHGELRDESAAAELVRAAALRAAFISVSHTQRRSIALPWTGTVRNGIRVQDYPLRTRKDDYVLFLGRMSADKGVDLAIKAARAARRPLVLAGSWTVPSERAYFEEQVAPMLGRDTRWVGAVGGTEKIDLLANARCLLFPCRWNEPFGLTVAEALACGTPVVALRAGAIPELVEHERTGILCDTPAALPGAIDAVGRLDPYACRAVATTRFSAQRMALEYERFYRQVIETRVRGRAARKQ
jgi:glycosyltransferase involved in cell wall biosynthesis